MHMGYVHLLVFGVICVAALLLVTYLSPRLMLLPYKRAFLVKGFGEGPIPINTLYTQAKSIFADPLAPLPPGSSNLMNVGTNRDALMVCGWLDLSKGALVLHVPEMKGRYYSVQFTDPSFNTNFAYVGRRTTGTEAGDYLIVGPGWKGAAPEGMKQISSPNKSVLLVGRVFVADNDDLETAYGLAKQIQLTPLNEWKPER